MHFCSPIQCTPVLFLKAELTLSLFSLHMDGVNFWLTERMPAAVARLLNSKKMNKKYSISWDYDLVGDWDNSVWAADQGTQSEYSEADQFSVSDGSNMCWCYEQGPDAHSVNNKVTRLQIQSDVSLCILRRKRIGKINSITTERPFQFTVKKEKKRNR